MVIDTSNPIIWKAKADVSEFKAAWPIVQSVFQPGLHREVLAGKNGKKKKKELYVVVC